MIGTGPSLTQEQIATARRKGFALAGCNNVWQIVPDLAVLYCCNENYWDHYWPRGLAEYPAEKWTANRLAAGRYGLNWIAEKNAEGLSEDPAVIHHGYGSGYSLLNLVYLMRPSRIVLLGTDLKYAKNYCGARQLIGSTPRHYFGEYPAELQHWPRLKVREGVHFELVRMYTLLNKQQLRCPIINCSPGSALTALPMMDISDVSDGD